VADRGKASLVAARITLTITSISRRPRLGGSASELVLKSVWTYATAESLRLERNWCCYVAGINHRDPQCSPKFKVTLIIGRPPS